jgi:transcriptional regulator
MSYLIKVAAIDIILSLRRRGWSQRRIASELDINRETVALMFGQPATPLRLGRSRKPW